METPNQLTRPSQLVEVDKFTAISLRMQLNQKLMAGSCAFDKPLQLTFSEAELNVLQVITKERLTNNTLLRKQAVHALVQQKSLDTLDIMMQLATEKHEEEVIRTVALQTVHALSPGTGRAMMENVLATSSPSLSISILRYLNQTEGAAEKALVDQFLSLKKNQRIRQQWEKPPTKYEQRTAPQPDKTITRGSTY